MTKSVKPFFARFLETPKEDELLARTDVKAGGYSPNDPIFQNTKKYPSDGDDSGNSGFMDWDWEK